MWLNITHTTHLSDDEMLCLSWIEGKSQLLSRPKCLRWDYGKTCQLVNSPKQDVSAVCVRRAQAQVNKHGQSQFAKHCLLLRDEDACQLGMKAGCVLKVNE